MKKLELVYREMLYQSIELKNRVLTQSELARTLNISLSTVNNAIRPLVSMGAIKINPRNLHVLDVRKILHYWASIRNIQKDVVYSTRVDKPVKEIEKLMPNDITFGVYSAYKFLYKDIPADYSEVYVYGDSSLKNRFPERPGPPNLFVLKKDLRIERYGKNTTIANTFVDLWNIKEWYAKEFLKAIEEKLRGILE